MALTSNNPINVDGTVYDRYAAHMAISPRWHDDRVGASIAVKLIPYRMGATGPELQEEQSQGLVFGDAFEDAANDADIAQFLQALESAAQAFIDAKGI